MRLTKWEGMDADGPRAVTVRHDGPFAPIMQEVLRKLAKFEDMEEARMKIKLDPGAYMPERAHDEDAGLDLRAKESAWVHPEEFIVIDTGVHVAVPHGYVGLITSKSGLMAQGITCRGTIDSGYTGSIRAVLYNHSKNGILVTAGDKICQLVLVPIIAPELELVAELEETERGDGGFGSTGR